MKSGGLPYFGGKSPRRDLTKWIVGHLPWEYKTLYVEPFLGMAGVLLSRPPTHVEIGNDRNDRLANWWTCIRDHPEEFGRKLDWTPQNCRTEFERSLANLDHPDPITKAVAYTVVVLASIWHSDARSVNRYRPYYSTKVGAKPSWGTEDILRLRARTRDIQIENVDAVELLDRIKDVDDAVIYCDPPYRGADTSPYRFTPDWGALGEVLRIQRGRVAISGYGEDWDCLGWRSEEIASGIHVYTGGEQTSLERAEKLWMNYDPVSERLFD